MQGSNEWKEMKIKSRYVSGTTIQAICNEHPFKTADDIFNEINGIVPHFSGNDYSRLGNIMEEKIIQKYRIMTGYQIDSDQPMFNYPSNSHIGISPDGIICNENTFQPLEIKYAPKRKIMKGYIPNYYAGQLQLTMAVCSSVWNIPVTSMTFIQTDSTMELDIITVIADQDYLKNRLIKIQKFIDRVESYRQKNPQWLKNYFAWDLQ